MSVKSIKFEKKYLRVIIILSALAGVIFFLFSIKWYLAHTISTQSQYTDLAEWSISLAPDDPQTHYGAAILFEKTFLPEDLEKSLAEYQKTAALTPNNYLAWLDVGKAFERAGNPELAEKSYRKAEQLAPNYANVKWTVGNFLLRMGNATEGFEKIRYAAETNNNYSNPFISIVRQSFDGNIETTKSVVGDSIKLRSALAVFLAGEKKFDDSMNIWNSLPANEKITALKADGEAIYTQLIAGKRFLQALEIKSQTNEAKNYEIGKISNGGFETDIQTKNDGIFEWTIADGFHPQIGIDDQQKKDGTRSLVYIFNSDDGREYRRISQIVAVKSGMKYKLQFFYKSALKTNSTIKCEILNAFDGSLIAQTEAVQAVSDWTIETVEFTVPENMQGIVLSLNRATCASAICPISGKIWLDGFNLSEN